MTNKYLMKLANMQQSGDNTNKTFLQSSVAGWGGHLGGAVAGGIGLSLLAGRNKRVGALANKAYQGSKSLFGKAGKSPIGRFAKKHMNGPAGVVGAAAGGFIGEEASNYAAIRHNKKQANDK